MHYICIFFVYPRIVIIKRRRSSSTDVSTTKQDLFYANKL